jgi:hypothetical protein
MIVLVCIAMGLDTYVRPPLVNLRRVGRGMKQSRPNVGSLALKGNSRLLNAATECENSKE